MTALGLIRFAAFFCLMSAAGQLVLKQRKRENYNLFLLFNLMGIILLQFYAIISGEALSNPLLISYHSTLFYIFCPVLYYALYAVSLPEKNFPEKFYLFLIPAIIAFCFDSFVILQSPEFRHLLVTQFFSGVNSPAVIIFRIITTGACIQILVYNIWLVTVLLPSIKGGGEKKIIYTTFLFSFLSAISSAMSIPGYLYGKREFIMYCGTTTSLCIVLLYLTGTRYPDFLQLLSMKVSRGIYSRSLLGGVDVEMIMRKLSELMRNEKIFESDSLTLKDTASMVNLTHHQLSQLLNERLNMNFNTYINTYRIEEAKRLLVEDPGKTVLTIAYQVGFNSKSSFYESFTKLAGVTPLEFRKRNS